MWGSPTVEQYDERISEDSKQVDIDGLEEARCAALVQSTRYLEGIRRYHDRNIKEHPSTLAISSSAASRTRKDYTSSARHGKVPSQLQRRPNQAHIASRHLKVKTSVTRGTSTSSVGSTRSLSTTLGAQVYTTTPESFAVSGLRVQALVSELLYSKIQR
jgi:hypothetical protein